MDDLDLKKAYPWLAFVEPTLHRIGVTLFKKERDYGGSWIKRGGIGAFMMLARKWDRIEKMAAENSYDVIRLAVDNPGDVRDDIDDLIAYLTLVRSEVDRQIAAPAAPTEPVRTPVTNPAVNPIGPGKPKPIAPPLPEYLLPPIAPPLPEHLLPPIAPPLPEHLLPPDEPKGPDMGYNRGRAL